LKIERHTISLQITTPSKMVAPSPSYLQRQPKITPQPLKTRCA